MKRTELNHLLPRMVLTMPHLTSETFDQNARDDLRDVQLHGALQNLASTFGERRQAAIRSVDDWEGLRERAREIKDETLSHLDKYLEQFTENAEKAGAMIHWARDGKEACDIILALINELSATKVVKSKSMATEEIHLNHALEAAGINPVETDLGEWIIQLAEETPSHIVVPAIHKSKGQIADLFVEKVGIEPTGDVDVLTATARKFLRSRFAEAEIGISGVNFGVAETGTMLILENEGNIRLTTSLPKRHIALMGIEKVIPKFADLYFIFIFLNLSEIAAPLRDWSKIDRLSVADHWNETKTGGRRTRGSSHYSNGQGAFTNARPSGHAAKPCVHSLRGMPECLSGLSADRRPRIRLGLSRPDRCGDHAAVDRSWKSKTIALRFEFVRCVPRGLSRYSRASASLAG